MKHANSINKVFTFILVYMISAILICPMSINAEEKSNETVFKFQKFSYVTSDIDKNSVIKYSKTDTEERYTIYDSNNGLVIDEIFVRYIPENCICNVNSSNTTSAFFGRNTTFFSGSPLKTTLRYTVNVQYYSSWSNRCFEAINYTHLAPEGSSIPSLGDWNDSCRSHTGTFPTTRLDFSYSATLSVSAEAAITSGLGTNDLINLGFYANVNAYSKTVNSSGYFTLY